MRGLARHGHPIQYAHVREPLALWDVWTRIAADPLAFEPPSAAFALDWRTLEAWRDRGVGFTTLTHAAGISSAFGRSADVILAKELKRLICRWHAFVKGIDSCLVCHHAILITRVQKVRIALQQHRDALI
jgi:hypothetical protein